MIPYFKLTLYLYHFCILAENTHERSLKVSYPNSFSCDLLEASYFATRVPGVILKSIDMRLSLILVIAMDGSHQVNAHNDNAIMISHRSDN